MARRLRIQTAGFIRHVMARGNAKMPIFVDEVDYRQFEYMLGEVVVEYGIECWNYCLMPNHYHATLCPSRSNLSQAMQSLNGVYAQWWNYRHKRVGHVFQGRFKAQIVQKESYLLALCRYVARNPVRAQLTDLPEDWRWSSYGGIVGLRASPFVDPLLTLRLFGNGDVPSLQSRFASFVQAQTGDEVTTDRIRSNATILGDLAFKNALMGPVPESSRNAVMQEPTGPFAGDAV